MNLFPYDIVRKGQQEFMQDAETAIKNKQHLLADAPTGIGKTAAVLSAALEYAIEQNKAIIFATPRHSQHRLVIETAQIISRKMIGSKQKVRAVDVIGKQWMCSQPVVENLATSDFSQYCKYLKEHGQCQYFRRTRGGQGLTKLAHAHVSKLRHMGPIHAEQLRETCQGFCAYEILMKLASKSNLIVCDYYHIFSHIDTQMLNRMKKELGDIILIVDEAHNLPSRIRKLTSATISTVSLNYAKKEAARYEYNDILQDIKNISNILKKLCIEDRFVGKHEFLSRINDFEILVGDLESAAEVVRADRQRSFMGSLSDFLKAWRGDDTGFARIIKKGISSRGKKYVSLSYDCLDPSIVTKSIFDSMHASIIMSGTLKPMGMYTDMLGLDTYRIMEKEYESPFPKNNRLDIIIPDVSTRYPERTTEQYKLYARYISECVESIDGNVAVFFPSYYLKEQIMKFVSTRKRIFTENQGLTKEEKTRLYKDFVSNRNAVLAAVQAGSFGEGVDYIGKNLNGVIVVGLSLEKPTLKVKALIDYYDKKFGRGWDYAYAFPAVQRAIQSSGRCIRSETDTGVCVFMDKRFLWQNYRKIFPKTFLPITTTNPAKEIKGFFGGLQPSS